MKGTVPDYHGGEGACFTKQVLGKIQFPDRLGQVDNKVDRKAMPKSLTFLAGI
jgi:hypothetical protein